MPKIEIRDISNGWLVDFYSGDSLSKDSYTKFFEDWEKAIEEIDQWAKDHNLPAYFKEAEE